MPVSMASHAWSPAVAEMALALMLSALRKVADHQAAMRAGREKWVHPPEGVDPDERQLTGRPVGIVGFGAIGRRLRQLLAPFECEVRACDPFVPESVFRRARALGGHRLWNC